MSETLAASALRLCGLACRHLGWRPPDFWAATPSEIAAILCAQDESGVGTISRAELDQLMEGDAHGR